MPFGSKKTFVSSVVFDLMYAYFSVPVLCVSAQDTPPFPAVIAWKLLGHSVSIPQG